MYITDQTIHLQREFENPNVFNFEGDEKLLQLTVKVDGTNINKNLSSSPSGSEQLFNTIG